MIVPDDNIMADDHEYASVSTWHREDVDVLNFRPSGSALIRRPRGTEFWVDVKRDIGPITHVRKS